MHQPLATIDDLVCVGACLSSSRTGRPDINQMASQMASNLIDAISGELPQEQPETTRKNPAAVALGRLGGLKGERRAPALSKRPRSEIARKAATKRWKTHS